MSDYALLLTSYISSYVKVIMCSCFNGFIQSFFLQYLKVIQLLQKILFSKSHSKWENAQILMKQSVRFCLCTHFIYLVIHRGKFFSTVIKSLSDAFGLRLYKVLENRSDDQNHKSSENIEKEYNKC